MKSKITKEALNKVENFFAKGFVKDTIELSILKNPDGTYDLFDRYKVSRENGKYKVEVKYIIDTYYFNNLKSAFTWVIFHKRNFFKHMARVEYLDQKLEGITFSISHLSAMLNKTKDIESQLIYGAKLSQDEVVKKKLLSELNKLIEEAKSWHFKAFAAKE